MKLGHIFWGLPIFLGILAASLYPYPAFKLNTIIYYLLFIIMLLTSINYKTSFNQIKKSDLPFMLKLFFFGFMFMPALQWLLAKFLISDDLLQQGLVFAALSPIAIVAPHFVKLQKGNDHLSYQLMLISTFFSPLVLFLMSLIFASDKVEIDFFSYIKDLVFLCVVPILMAMFIKLFYRQKENSRFKLNRLLPGLNMICIGLITYTLMGTMLVKIGFSTIGFRDLGFVLLLAVFQDFGTYFLGNYLFSKEVKHEIKSTLVTSVAIKNVAMTAGLLLFYQPKMSFAAACVLLVHAAFFIYLSLTSKEKSTT